MKPWRALLALTALLVLADTNVRQLYERARLLQESNRNLEEAIGLYGEVIKRAGQDRALAAESQFQQGVLYLRLGRTQAAEHAFRTVTSEYPDQPRVVGEARARLNTNRFSKPASMRQVWSSGDADASGAPSPDGRYISYTDWNTGDLGIRDLLTGENRHITRKETGFQETLRGQAQSSVFSPDSKRVAFWWVDEPPRSELRVIGIDGSGSRLVTRLDGADFVKLSDWSSDGKYIVAYIVYGTSRSEIVLITAGDGSLRTLAQATVWPGRMSFSPDNRFILHDGRGSPGSDLYLLAVDTGLDSPIVQHPGNDFAFGWSPDGKQILFGSERTGTVGLWMLQVDNGVALGEVRLVRNGVGKITPLGRTRSGAVYYWLDTGLFNIYSAAIDLETGAVLEVPAPVPDRYVGSNRFPDWSPDGKALLYQSNRPGSPPIIVVRALETGVEREIRPDPPLSFVVPRWNRTGDGVLVSATVAGRSGIYQIDIRTGALTLAVEMPPDRLMSEPAWSPDGRSLYGRFNDFNGIHKLSVATGVIQTLFDPHDPPGPFHEGDTGPSEAAVSPDGTSLIFQQRDRPRSDNILLMPVTGGMPKVLLTGKWPDRWFPVGAYAWTPDSRHIVFAQRAGGPGEVIAIGRIDPVTGEQRMTGVRMNNIRRLRLHPDGRHIAFMAGDQNGEVWVAENLF